MRIRRKIPLLIYLFAQLGFQISGQEKTLFFMDVPALNNALNAAFQFDNSFVSINPAAGFSFVNSTFRLSNLMTRKMVPGKDTLFWNFDEIGGKIRETNYITLNNSLNFIYLGLKLKERSFGTFSVSARNDYYFQYPRSIADLVKGNTDLNSGNVRQISLKNITLNGYSSLEYSFGFSHRTGDRLWFGAHLKLLDAAAGIQTKKFDAEVRTANDYSDVELDLDASINFTGDIFNVSADNQKNLERIELNHPENPGKYLFFKNYGLAADIGGIYKISEKALISLSLNDLGFINWNARSKNLDFSGIYNFRGIRIDDDNLNSFNFNEEMNKLGDTLQSVITPEVFSGKVHTGLFPNLYFGGIVDLNNWLKLNGLFRMTFYSKDLHPANFTAGAIINPLKWLSFSGSWSYSDYTFGNLGAGFVIGGERFRFFMATDNILSADWLNTKGASLAAGCSLILWKNKPSTK